MEMRYGNMSQAYEDLAYLLSAVGEKVGNTHELNNMQFTLTNPKNNLSLSRSGSKYGLSLSYALGELIWYLSGDNSTRFISNFGSLWKRISDNGVTNNSAYGYLIQHKHGFNQLKLMYDILVDDPNSRRAVININTPHKEVIETKDEPCTISIQFFLRQGKLNATTVMRSNDIWFGTPYDVIYFTTLQQILAKELNVELGTYTHFAGSLHVYDSVFEDVKLAGSVYQKYDESLNIDVLALNEHVLDIKKELVSMDGDMKKNVITIAKKYDIIK